VVGNPEVVTSATIRHRCSSTGDFRVAGDSPGTTNLSIRPNRIENWSPISLRRSFLKTGELLAKHARYYWLMLAEGHRTRIGFVPMLRGIAQLPLPASWPVDRGVANPNHECQRWMDWCRRN
jgi:hypothetical protein